MSWLSVLGLSLPTKRMLRWCLVSGSCGSSARFSPLRVLLGETLEMLSDKAVLPSWWVSAAQRVPTWIHQPSHWIHHRDQANPPLDWGISLERLLQCS